MDPTVEIVDVGPRDGLRNDDRTLSPRTRARAARDGIARGVYKAGVFEPVTG